MSANYCYNFVFVLFAPQGGEMNTSSVYKSKAKLWNVTK